MGFAARLLETGTSTPRALHALREGNALRVLRDISDALDELVVSGETTVIDLCAISLNRDDESLLDRALGDGELDATVNIHGEVRVRETSIPGVWRVERFGPRRRLAARVIEVTFMPEILQTRVEEVRRGQTRLDRWIEAGAKPENT